MIVVSISATSTEAIEKSRQSKFGVPRVPPDTCFSVKSNGSDNVVINLGGVEARVLSEDLARIISILKEQ